MRIIAGERKGRHLESVKGLNTRPTSDRVKESLFNIIQSIIADKTVLDLFSGTGNLGLEALSRGSKRCVFVEKAPQAIRVLRKNCTNLGYLTKSRILPMDAFKAIEQLSKDNECFDIVFMDPPYAKGKEIPVIEAIIQNNILNTEGIIIIEHSTNDKQSDVINNVVKFDERKYGNTSISFYRKGDAQ